MEKEKWILKIRPWYGHHDHYHVRLKCPEKSPHCVTQEKVTEPICDSEELEEWFTDEAKEKQRAYFKHQLKEKEEVPELPTQCLEVLKK